ncbi:MAG: hypothetical protein GXO69_02315 [Acidobacteria bacterium]|nr:hypothetical protein [Acidobacteriota bacterium]
MSKILSFLLLFISTFPVLAGTTVHRTGLLFRDPKLDPHAKQVQSLSLLKQYNKAKSLPASVDNSAFLPPVDSQGGQGSCVAWAVGYYMRSELENYALGRTDSAQKSLDCNRFSPAFLYDMIHSPGDNGAYYTDAFEALATFGCCSWDTMPYTDTDYTRWPTEAAFMESMRYRTGADNSTANYYYEDMKTDSNLNDIKQLLANGKAVIISIFVYTPYNSLNENNDEYTIANGLAGTMGGGHAQCVIGYDDNHQTADGMGAFRVVNSWGTNWGDHGFYWISYKAMKFNDTNHDGQVTTGDSAICTGRVYWVDRIPYQTAQYVVKFDITHPGFRSLDMELDRGEESLPLFNFYTWHQSPQRNYQDVTDGCMAVDADVLFPQQAKDSSVLQLKIRDVKPGGSTGVVEDFQLSGPDGTVVSDAVPYAIPEIPESRDDYGVLELNPGDCEAALRDLPQVASWEGRVMYLDVAVKGDTAYGVSNGYLDVLNVTNPTNPARIGEYSGLGYCYGVDVSGTVAVVADYSGKLWLLDVSNPGAIVELSEFAISGVHPYKVDISNDIAYVTLLGGGVAIVDISDPANPVLESRITMSYSRDAKISGNNLFVADGYNGLQVYDVSDPTAPVKIGGYSSGSFAYAVAINGSKAVLGDSSPGLTLLDISTPSAPVNLSFVSLAGVPYRVDLDDSRAFAAEGSHGIEAIDVSTPAAISKISVIQPEDFTRGVAIAGDTLFFADRDAGMGVEDVTDISSMSELGRYDGIVPRKIFTGGDNMLITSLRDNEARFAVAEKDGVIRTCGALYLSHPVAFAALNKNGLAVLVAGERDTVFAVDVTDIDKPVKKGELVFNGKHIRGVVLDGSRAYISVEEDGVYTLDFSDPTHPTAVKSFEMAGAAALLLTDNFLAVADSVDNTVRLLSIVAPENLTQMSSIPMGTVAGLSIDSGYLFAACSDNGLTAADVSDPVHPGSVIDVSSLSVDMMVVRDNVAYILNGPRIVELNVEKPASPVEIGVHNFTDVSFLAATSSFIALSDAGTSMLRLEPLVQQYAIPHVAESGWTTAVVLYNENPYDIGIRVNKWGNDGTLEMENGVYRVPAESSLSLSNDNFGPDGTAGIAAGALNLKTKLSYRYRQSPSLCEFFVNPGELADRYMLANTYRPWFDWFGLVVANGGERTAHVSLSAWKDGVLQGVKENVEILPHTKYVKLCQDIWPGLSYNGIDMVTIDSDIPIEPPISITGNTAQDRHVFFTAQALTTGTDTENALYLTHIPDGSWHTTLTFYNTTADSKQLTLTQWGDDGSVLVNGSSYMVPAMDKLVLSSDNGDFQSQGMGKILAENGIIAKLSYQYQDSHSFCEFFLDRNQTATKWLLTNSIQDFFQWFGVAVSNPTDAAVNITMKAMKNGVVVGVTSFSLAAHSKRVGTVSDFWDGLSYDGLDSVVLESDQPIPAPISITGNSAQDRHVFFNGSDLN